MDVTPDLKFDTIETLYKDADTLGRALIRLMIGTRIIFDSKLSAGVKSDALKTAISCYRTDVEINLLNTLSECYQKSEDEFDVIFNTFGEQATMMRDKMHARMNTLMMLFEEEAKGRVKKEK